MLNLLARNIMKKKFLSIIIVLCMMLPYMFSVASYAANPDVTFSVASMNAQRGETITVKVNMTCVTSFSAANFTLSYDSNVLEYVPYLNSSNEVDYSQNCGSTIPSDGTVVINSNTAGTIKVGYMSQSSVAGKNGEFLKFKFKVKSNATYGNSNVTLTATTLKSSNGTNLNGTYNNGVVSILSGITMSNSTLQMAEGTQQQLSVSSSNGTIFDTVTWSSNNTSVATVSANTDTKSATITAVTPGTATITATVGGKSATCTVTVIDSYTISINNPAWSFLPKDQKRTLTVTFNPASAGTGKTVTWTSSNTNVATINSSTGEITAKASTGTTVITATAGNKTNTYTLTVQGILGDIDGDSKITAYDAYRALVLYAAEATQQQVDPDEVVVLDVEKNGSMSSNDSYLILKYSVGLLASFV